MRLYGNKRLWMQNKARARVMERFQLAPLLTYIQHILKPCHAFRWLMLRGSNHHHHSRGKGGILPETAAVSRWGFPPLAWHACSQTLTLILQSMPKSSQLKSPPLGTLRSTFHCTEWVPFQSRSSAGKHVMAMGAKDSTFFHAPLKQEEARGTRTIDWQV